MNVDLIDKDEAKLNVLMHMHSHMYKEMLNLRGTMIKLLVAYSGANIGLTGWITTKSGSINVIELTYSIIGISVVFFTFYLISIALNRYFCEIADVITRIEGVVGMYDPGVYFSCGDANKTVMPVSWNMDNPLDWNDPIFKITKRYSVLTFPFFLVIPVLKYILF
jgi:hypothetical protein